ncbi:multicopper oxidase family protein [Nibrella saemangeumensis]|uniref:Multicopper oxidase family protein n=1 Tax=Nibrella saemangeumensis TaxID=1084526 RepID=A0ABP8NFR7_9BACT
MNRQHFLKTVGWGAVASLTGTALLTGCNNHDMSDIDMMPDMEGMGPAVKETPFTTPLRFPETVTGSAQLTAKSGTEAILPGKNARVLGYRNGILGPTLRVQSGSEVTFRFSNNLSEDSNIHWHGLLVPAEMDGHPAQVVRAGESFPYTFRINQAASTAWYHPHPHEKTARQAYLGLAGMIIVETPTERALNLPSGSYELPLIIQDKRLDGTGSPQYTPTMQDVMMGFMGETITVNGVGGAFHPVATRMYRMRVVNGSNGRIYNLALSNEAPFWVIGTDGGLLPTPEAVTALLLSPGERADLLVDFSKLPVGTELYLKSNTFPGASAQGKQAFNILKFRVDKAETDSFQMPASLATITTLSTAAVAKSRSFSIGMNMGNMNMGNMKGMHTINGKVYSMDRIDETVKLGDTEIWDFDNKGDEPHPMHLHSTFFQVLSRVGGRNTLFANEKGWKDTVLVMPGERVRVICRFDKPGLFVAHCHNLEHEDDGMMLNFRVS